MTVDLVTWFKSALDEDEAAEHGKWKWGVDISAKPCPRCGDYVESIESTFHVAGMTLLPCRDELTQEEWKVYAEVQPAPDESRLAELAALRTVLDLHSPAGVTSDPPYKWACSVCHRRDGWWAGEYPCTTVRLLVAPFASRPGFDPSWLD